MTPIIRHATKLIDWPSPFPQAAAQVVLDRIRANAKRHIGSFGRSYPADSQGDPDWRESGHLLDDARAYRGGRIRFFAYYASYVNQRYPFADGFTDEEKKEMGVLIKPILLAAMGKK